MAVSTYTVVRENWLTRRLDPAGVSVAVISTLFLILASLLYWNNIIGLEPLMAASRDSVFSRHEYWRVWSTLFAHADLRHLLSNSLLYFIVGTFLAGYFGAVVFPFGAVVMGGLINLIVLWGMPPTVQLIGVSGVVFWMGGFWLMLYFLLERRKSLTQRSLRALGVALVLFMPAEAFDPSISYESHFVGFVLGVLSGGVYYYLRKPVLRSAEKIETVIDSDIDENLIADTDGQST